MAATIDEAPEILPNIGPDVVGGYSNNGPMVAKALCTQGPPDSMSPWKMAAVQASLSVMTRLYGPY